METNTYKKGQWVEGIYFNPTDLKAMCSAVKLAETAPINVLMVGPSGYGKTTMPMAIAKMHEMDYVRINCARVRDPVEWFGYREAIEGSTCFVPTEFTKAVEGGNTVIVLDEFNRVEPWLHNTLYPLLDDSRETIVHNTHIKVGEKVMFVATVNLGYMFTGTFALDAALQNRMDMTILVKPLPKPVEVQLLRKRWRIGRTRALMVVDLMVKLRELAEDSQMEVDLSTRSSLKVARLVKAGMPMKEAMQYTLLNALNKEEVKSAIDVLNTYLGEGAKEDEQREEQDDDDDELF